MQLDVKTEDIVWLENLCLEAVKKNGLELQHVPENLKELCPIAVKNNTNEFSNFKQHIETKQNDEKPNFTWTVEMYAEACRQGKMSISGVPYDMRRDVQEFLGVSYGERRY